MISGLSFYKWTFLTISTFLLALLFYFSDFMSLFDKVGKDPKGLEGKHLRLERVPICYCIHVKGLKKETSDDLIGLYFENHRKSGGSRVSRVERKEQDEALVYFEDPSCKYSFFQTSVIPYFFSNYSPLSIERSYQKMQNFAYYNDG